MKKSKLQLAHPRIIKFFRAPQQRTWTRRQLGIALTEMREEWQVAQRMSLTTFLEFLINETAFVQTSLSFPYTFEFVERFWWGEPTVYEVAESLHAKGYFSHHSALHLHGLMKVEPETIYFNIEQPATGASTGKLQQKSIDAAFQRPGRVSNNRVDYDDKTICLLSGKNTGNLGVVERKWPKHGLLRVTSMERTLVDCAVRSVYSGGPSQVLKAYENAAGKVTPEGIATLLEKLNYIYPYNQAIGFYLEQSGMYSEAEVNLFRRADMAHDFYLDYEMIAPSYSEKWRLYYPAELDE